MLPKNILLRVMPDMGCSQLDFLSPGVCVGGGGGGGGGGSKER